MLRFDASPATQAAVKRMLKIDPRVLRVGCVKVGDGRMGAGAVGVEEGEGGNGNGNGNGNGSGGGVVWSRREGGVGRVGGI